MPYRHMLNRVRRVHLATPPDTVPVEPGRQAYRPEETP